MNQVFRQLRSRFWRAAILMCVTLALTASAAFAQSLYGSITGVVKDPQGGTVPGATVTVINKDTNLTREAVSDAEGYFHSIRMN